MKQKRYIYKGKTIRLALTPNNLFIIGRPCQLCVLKLDPDICISRLKKGPNKGMNRYPCTNTHHWVWSDKRKKKC